MKKGILTKGLLLAASTLLVATLSACRASSTGAQTKDKMTIGILQQLDQKAFDDTKKGITEELAKQGYKNKVTIKTLNAQGDQSNLNTMSQQLVRANNKVNISIGTAASQAMEKAGGKAPLLFTAITDPVGAGLIKDPQHPTTATGVTDIVDVKMQIGMLHRLFPKAKRIGMMYNPAEQNSLFIVKKARTAIKALGLTPVEKTASSSNEVEAAITALCKQSDALFIPNDNIAAVAMPTIGKLSEKFKVPVVNADATMNKYAGVATKGISFEDIGRQTARMAIKVLSGKSVKQIPMEQPDKILLVQDQKRMQLFGISEADLKRAAK